MFHCSAHLGATRPTAGVEASFARAPHPIRTFLTILPPSTQGSPNAASARVLEKLLRWAKKARPAASLLATRWAQTLAATGKIEECHLYGPNDPLSSPVQLNCVHAPDRTGDEGRSPDATLGRRKRDLRPPGNRRAIRLASDSGDHLGWKTHWHCMSSLSLISFASFSISTSGSWSSVYSTMMYPGSHLTL
jgi:hypothetical protein